MNGLGAMLQTMVVLQQQASFPPLSEGVINALGPRVVISPAVLGPLVMLDAGKLAYTLIGRVVLHEAVTGAVVYGSVLPVMVDTFNRLGAQPGWMNRALILIVAETHNPLVFKEFWSRRTSNVLFHTPGGLFAYNPFTDLVFRVEDETRLKEVLRRRWNDMMGCPVIVDIASHLLGYLEDQPIRLGAGIDASALSELQKHWNITLLLYKSYEFEGDDQLEISNKHLLAGKTELGMNARFMIQADQVYLEYSTTVFADSVVLVMRQPDKLRGWDVFIRIFRWKVWLAILITIIIVVKFLKIFSDKSHRYNLVLTLRNIFSIPVHKAPDRRSGRMLIGCALMSTIIVNLYMARLYHIIESRQTYESPQTVLEVNKLGIPLLGTRKGLHEYFEMRENPEVKSMGSKIKVEKNISDELLQYNVYVVRENEMKLYMDSSMIRKDIHFVPEKVLSFTMAYVVKRGSPFLEPLSDFTSRAFEAGLHHWWFIATVITFRAQHARNTTHVPEEPSSRELKIADIEVAFFVLCAGVAISLAAFLMELFVKHIARRRFHFTINFLQKVADCCPEDTPSYMA